MFLANLPDVDYGEENVYRQFAPVMWLLNFLDSRAFAGVELRSRLANQTDETRHPGENTFYTEHGYAEEESGYMGSEYIRTRADSGASWRDMKVSNLARVEPATVSAELHILQCGMILLHPAEYDSTPDLVNDTKPVSWKIEGGQTLGEFFDNYVKALEELRKKAGARHKAKQRRKIQAQAACWCG